MPIYYELSASQRDIWFDQQLNLQQPLYNIGSYWIIDGPIQPQLFQQAIAKVVADNDALRTILVKGDTLPVQNFSAEVIGEVAYHDVSENPQPHLQALTWIQTEFTKPFELYGKPLFQFALLKLSTQRYYWLQKYHHLITDGWGISVVGQQVAATYQQLATQQNEDTRTAVPKSPTKASTPTEEWDSRAVSYTTFLAEDQQYFTSAHYAKDQAYWREQYRTLPPSLGLRPRFKSLASASQQTTLVLDTATYQRLIDFAQAHQSTTFHFWLGLCYTYFVRAYQTPEWAVKLPVLNRPKPAFKQTTGLCTSIIPTRLAYGIDLHFSQLMLAIGRKLRQDYRHQRLPFSHLQRLLGFKPQEGINHFEITVSYEKLEYPSQFAGWPMQVIMQSNQAEPQPLAIFIREYQAQQAVRLDFHYNLAVFAPAEMEWLTARFAHLIEEVQQHPDRPLRELSLIPATERQQLLMAWNDTTVPKSEDLDSRALYPHDGGIHQLFEAQVERTPEQIAVVFQTQSLTYQELNQRANQLAHHLQTLGVGPETIVGLHVERSLAMVIGVLGILKAGGVYLPLDPTYPTERLAFILTDAQPAVICTQSQVSADIPTEGIARWINLNDPHFTTLAVTNPTTKVSANQLAYIIYTSGSTGKPKGTLLEHGGLCNLAQAEINLFGLTQGCRVLQFTSLNFDVSISDIVMTLCSGATLYLAATTDLTTLTQSLAEQEITHLEIAPTGLANLSPERLPQLNTLIVGGEPCPLALVKRWREGRQFFNAYGPTEATVCATLMAGQQITDWHSTPPIGRPLPNVQIYILDRWQQLTPIGVPGELCIGGVGVARGYLNRPELTAEKFIPNPFGKGRLYRTGDLARWLTDGHLEFLGRLDHQVKIRGIRIEPGEIETVLMTHPTVQEAVVIAREEASGERSLVGYIVPTSNPQNLESHPSDWANPLRAYLQTQLPDAMIPSLWVRIAALPLTPNGKVDRQALPAPSSPMRHRTTELVLPTTPTEIAIAQIWQTVLGSTELSIHDDFLALGGHSLLAMQIVARLRDTYQVELTLRWMFQQPTVAKLAEYIDTISLTKGLQQGITPLSGVLSLPNEVPQLPTTAILEEISL